jgi:predicted dehydrogenase
MKKIDIVIVGAGGFGKFYVDECFDGESRELVNVVGVVEPYPEACPRKQEIIERKIPVYSNLEEFYRDNKARLAAIATPIGFHTEQIIYCMQHGSDVLCEKPLCADETDIEKIAETEKKTGKTLTVGYQWSTSKAILDAKKDIISGIYGKPKLLKTLTLWPRDEKYFRRSTGWAGKIYDKDGRPVYDSIANNACAHYLHNLFFMLGKSMNTSLMPDSVYAELARVNNIENFDTAVIKCGFPEGADAWFIASHATAETVDPVLLYEFEKGKILLVNNSIGAPEENHMDSYINGEIIGILNDGRVIRYGIPDNGGNCRKLALCAKRIMGEKSYFCGTEGASVQTRVINYIQKNFDIMQVHRVKKTDGFKVAEGMGAVLCKLYSEPKKGELINFIEKEDKNERK